MSGREKLDGVEGGMRRRGNGGNRTGDGRGGEGGERACVAGNEGK